MNNETGEAPTTAVAQKEHNGHARPGGAPSIAEQARTEVPSVLHRMGQALKRPAMGAAVTGGVVIVAAGLWGVSEAMVATAAAYAVYRMLRKRSDAPVERAPSGAT